MRLRPVVLIACAAVVVSLVGGAPAQSEPGSTPAAARALAGARTVLAGGGDRDATLALRELRRHRDELSVGDRAAADAMLARPTTTSRTCYTLVCVHWSVTGPNAATATYVDRVGRIADHVLETYVAAGYRAPEADGLRGGNALLDIYLEDLGAQGLYGYCDSDGGVAQGGPYDTWAYCAFDNNYTEFPAHTPLENLQVTAAHELFHAVQFAYDYLEDGWFMEATATWAEDEVYDGVDDNVQYLVESPLSQPGRSMDHFGGLRQYGDWIFFRYLTERLDDAQGGLPTLVRQMWELADGSTGAPNEYSMQAIDEALAARGTSLRAVFADFAAANRRPGTSYTEGADNDYPSARPNGRVELSGGQRDSGWLSRQVDHLASTTLRFKRAPRMRAHQLRLRLDLPAKRRGSGAVATVYHTSGAPDTVPLTLYRRGDGSAKVDFGRDVKYVEVTLVNAGTHYRCWRRTGYSCQGRPTDDDLPLRVRARAVR